MLGVIMWKRQFNKTFWVFIKKSIIKQVTASLYRSHKNRWSKKHVIMLILLISPWYLSCHTYLWHLPIDTSGYWNIHCIYYENSAFFINYLLPWDSFWANQNAEGIILNLKTFFILLYKLKYGWSNRLFGIWGSKTVYSLVFQWENGYLLYLCWV